MMPNFSSNTLTKGARQLVVQEALETIGSSPVMSPSLTPMTYVGMEPLPGGDHNLLGSGFDVLAGTGLINENTGGLDDNVDAHVLPGKLEGVAVGDDLDHIAV